MSPRCFQGDGASKDDDVFYDPNDEWEPDLSASSSASSFSRRRWVRPVIPFSLRLLPNESGAILPFFLIPVLGPPPSVRFMMTK